MKADVKKILGKFTTDGIKRGDLVITAEIHRVVGFADQGGSIRVVTVSEDCEACGKKECMHERIMYPHFGQQGVMKLKRK